VLFLLLINLC